MKFAYIMRGLPGSGKSTVAKQLVANGGVIHSTDDYFLSCGKYTFDPNHIVEYHRMNLEAFRESLRQGKSVVVCDNTNVKWQHFEPYVKAAQDAGYVISLVTLPHPAPEVAALRTVHKVPVQAIRRMLAEWEN
jgi:predicted kinase